MASTVVHRSFSKFSIRLKQKYIDVIVTLKVEGQFSYSKPTE